MGNLRAGSMAPDPVASSWPVFLFLPQAYVIAARPGLLEAGRKGLLSTAGAGWLLCRCPLPSHFGGASLALAQKPELTEGGNVSGEEERPVVGGSGSWVGDA